MSHNKNRKFILFAFKHPLQAAVYILSLPIVVAALISAVLYSHRKSEGESPNKERPHLSKEETDEALALYTGWLMAFTGILAISTSALWWTTKRGMRDQARDMRKSLTIAEASAEAARQQVALTRASLDETRKSYELDLRPWLTIKDAAIFNNTLKITAESNQNILRIDFICALANTGRRAATFWVFADAMNGLDVENWMQRSVDTMQETFRKKGEGFGKFIAPNERITQRFGLAIDGAALNRRPFGHGTDAIQPFVGVTVFYRDIGNPEHIKCTSLGFVICRRGEDNEIYGLSISEFPIYQAIAVNYAIFAITT